MLSTQVPELWKSTKGPRAQSRSRVSVRMHRRSAPDIATVASRVECLAQGRLHWQDSRRMPWLASETESATPDKMVEILRKGGISWLGDGVGSGVILDLATKNGSGLRITGDDPNPGPAVGSRPGVDFA
jgi:hypothetical protein